MFPTVQAAALCLSAARDANGAFNITGVFTEITAPSMPGPVAFKYFVAVNREAVPDTVFEYNMRVVHADSGNPVSDIGWNEIQGTGKTPGTNITVQFNLQIAEEGRYVAECIVRNRATFAETRLCSASFSVCQVENETDSTEAVRAPDSLDAAAR